MISYYNMQWILKWGKVYRLLYKEEAAEWVLLLSSYIDKYQDHSKEE